MFLKKIWSHKNFGLQKRCGLEKKCWSGKKMLVWKKMLVPKQVWGLRASPENKFCSPPPKKKVYPKNILGLGASPNKETCPKQRKLQKFLFVSICSRKKGFVPKKFPQIWSQKSKSTNSSPGMILTSPRKIRYRWLEDDFNDSLCLRLELNCKD